jgi:hypothetical protein
MSECSFGVRLPAILEEHRDFDETDFADGIVLGDTCGQRLVGHGAVTREGLCGQVRGVRVCLNVHLHGQMTLDGVNHAGQVYYEKIRHSCHKPSCPTCVDTWVQVEAWRMTGRLGEASKHFGQVEHIVVSVPQKDLHLGTKKLVRKAQKILIGLGVLGGSILTHAFRYRPNHWYLGMHFHSLAFVLGGYGRCRHCEKRLHRACSFDCDGFNARCYKEFLRSGWIIRIAKDRCGHVDERRSPYWTAKYELSHATYEKVSEKGKRIHIVSWFGVCSYRKLKWTPEVKKRVCALCGYKLMRAVFVGAGRFDLMSERGWINETDEFDRPNFVPIRDRGGG